MLAIPELTAAARAQLQGLIGTNTRGAQDLLDRFDRWGQDLIEAFAQLYPIETALPQLIEVMAAAHLHRDEELQQRDRERVLEQDWFQSEKTIGYVAYADLFAKNLKGINKRIPYLKDLGITYLHLLPILKPRPGANDGGYAVMDYRALREDLGSMKELRSTADKLHDSGISLTLDLVLNHVAQEHEWAEKARSGDATYREYFYVYPDRTIPDEYEKTLLEVFPDFAPGNFTWDDKLQGWVWTTFNSYQWDVNWSNPAVFCEYADIIANLANHGVDCIRLDAIAFMWKRMGTICQGEPEVHVITQALRAFARILCPSMIFKAEAIVGPAQVGAYFGEGKHAGKVSDLAYHNSLMVQIWSAIAAKDTSLMVHTMSRFSGLPNTTAWGVYLRCHDDIGWAIDDTDAHEVGLNGHDHRLFLAEYFEGNFFGSLATGQPFMPDPVSGERRTSGTGASLAGIEKAIKLKDEKLLNQAIDRYLCAYTMVFGFAGIPLLYMGDEIGLLNDHSYLKDETKKEDNRWIHRPKMNWRVADAAAAGELDDKPAGRIYNRIKHVIDVRKSLPSLHASVATTVRAGSGKGVVIFDRKHPAGDLIEVYNLSESSRWLGSQELSGMTGKVTDHLTGHTFEIGNGVPLAPYEVRWFSQA
ncbi:alpha-amylase family protein [Aurantimicrobium minutum]|uniref:alpha-amylase family protein n=1 Tax=Aurantimicrobium minutum TaxID=708131 RepID=UPI0024760D40|nr:alpha-amylase family protein [Aurantimicrobium minutum]MDH6239824.1 amylosucrase [Aurantimicrobium minutum]